MIAIGAGNEQRRRIALTKRFGEFDIDARAVVKWLYDAKELVCNDEYLRLSRADFKDEQSSKSSQNRTRPANTFRKINQGSIPP